MTPKADHGYTVHRRTRPDDSINRLQCQFCAFSVNPIMLHRMGDKSGAGRYCRARAKMVKHLFAEHRAVLAKASGERT